MIGFEYVIQLRHQARSLDQISGNSRLMAFGANEGEGIRGHSRLVLDESPYIYVIVL